MCRFRWLLLPRLAWGGGWQPERCVGSPLAIAGFDRHARHIFAVSRIGGRPDRWRGKLYRLACKLFVFGQGIGSMSFQRNCPPCWWPSVSATGGCIAHRSGVHYRRLVIPLRERATRVFRSIDVCKPFTSSADYLPAPARLYMSPI